MVENPNNQDLFPQFEKQLQSPTYHDETMNRSFTTIYQNKTGKTMRVYVVTNSIPTEFVMLSAVDVQITVATPDDPMMAQEKIVDEFLQAGIFVMGSEILYTLVADIPPNWFYHALDLTGGLAIINNWMEVY